MADDGLALFLEQLNQPLLLLDQRVDLRSFVVEEGGDCFLFLSRGRMIVTSPKLSDRASVENRLHLLSAF